MSWIRFAPFAVIFSPLIILTGCVQDNRQHQFNHKGVGYRIVETIEPVRVKRETTTNTNSNTTKAAMLECYQFTWPGVSENNTIPDCTKTRKSAPCFPPFVFTNDTSRPEPDPAVAKAYCDAKKTCKVTCTKTNANTCIRYAYYSAGQAVNVTYFCGAVEDTTDDIVLKDGHVTDTMSGGLIIDVKFCQGDLCNLSSYKSASLVLILVSAVSLILFM